MKPAAFEYVAAHSLEEALAALQDGGEDAKPIAGGQSLVPALNMRLVRPTLLVDLNRAGLDSIEANGVVRIGATVRQAALEHDPRTHPLLREALPHVGHFVTRNRGTVGGSVAHADGAAEIPLCLAALGGVVVVEAGHLVGRADAEQRQRVGQPDPGRFRQPETRLRELADTKALSPPTLVAEVQPGRRSGAVAWATAAQNTGPRPATA